MFKKFLSSFVFIVLLLSLSGTASANLLTEETEVPENPYISTDVSDEAKEVDKITSATADLFCELFTYDDPESLFFDDENFLLNLANDKFGKYGYDFETYDDFFDKVESTLDDVENEFTLSEKIRSTCPDLADIIIDEVGLAEFEDEPFEYEFSESELVETGEGMYEIVPTDERQAFIDATIEATCMIFQADNIFDPSLEGKAMEIYKKYGFDAEDDAVMEALTSKYESDEDVQQQIMQGLEECGGDLFSGLEEAFEETINAPLYDVPEDHVNNKAIWYLFKEGIIDGYPDNSFKPDQNINRAEFLKILVEAKIGYAPYADYSNCYDDVTDQWFARYVCYATEKGWVQGYGDGLFRPEQPVNKVEALKMLLEVFNDEIYLEEEMVMVTPFIDVPADAWYFEYVVKGKLLGIVKVHGDELNFYPGQSMSRGAVSEYFYSLLMWIDDNALDKSPHFISLEEILSEGVVDIDSASYDYKLKCEQKYFDAFEDMKALHDSSTNIYSNDRNYNFNPVLEVFTFGNVEAVYVAVNSSCKDIAENYLNDVTDIDKFYYQWSGGHTLMHVAAMSGDMDIVKMVVDVGADIDIAAEPYENYYGNVLTPLYYAITNGHLDVAEYLIDQGADINKIYIDYGSMLMDAISSQSLEMVNWLLAQGFDPNVDDGYGFTALHAAVTGDNLDIVKALVNAGADLDAQDQMGAFPLSMALKTDHVENAKYLINAGANVNLISSSEGRTPLHEAAYYASAEIVELLLDEGAKINAVNFYGETPLHAAISGGSLEIVEKLVNAGADLEMADQQGFAALHFAASVGEVEIVEYLIDQGADVDGLYVNNWSAIRATVQYSEEIAVIQELIDAGADVDLEDLLDRTPLHEASYKGLLEIVELLLDEGANPDAQEQYGETPLHAAVSGGHLSVVEALIAAGADVDLKDDEGYTPLHVAVDFDEVNIMEVLVEAGAEVNALNDWGETPKDLAGSQTMLDNLPTEAKYSSEL